MTTPHDPNIIRHNPDDFQPFTPGAANSELLESIVEHVNATIGPVSHIDKAASSVQVHIDILIIAPTPDRPYHILVTAGMSDRPMATPPGHDDIAHAELCMILPPDWPLNAESLKDERHAWPLRWLRTLATFPHIANSFLTSEHTFPNGDPPDPFHPTTPFSCWFFLNPVPLPRPFRILKESSRDTHFLLVLPITQREMEVKLKQGAEALIPHITSLRPAEYFNPDRSTAGVGVPLTDKSVPMRLMLNTFPKVYQAYMNTPAWKKDMQPFAPRRSTLLLILGILLLLIVFTIPVGLIFMYMSGSAQRRYYKDLRKQMTTAMPVIVYPIMLNADLHRPDAIAPGLYLGSMDPTAPENDDSYLRPLWDAIDFADPNSPDPAVREVARILSDQKYVPGRRVLAPLSLTGGVRVHFFDTPVCASKLGGKPFEVPITLAMVTPGDDKGIIHLVPIDVASKALETAKLVVNEKQNATAR